MPMAKMLDLSLQRESLPFLPPLLGLSRAPATRRMEHPVTTRPYLGVRLRWWAATGSPLPREVARCPNVRAILDHENL